MRAVLAAAALVAALPCGAAELLRSDHLVEGEAGIGLYVREVRATLHPERVGHLVVLNTLYGGTDGHSMLGCGSDLEDKEHPGRPSKSLGAYRWSTAASLLAAWDRSIPLEDKSQWRDPAVTEAYVAAALESDPESGKRDPRAFRAPNGAMEDSFYLATGRSLWDASFVLAPTLVLASERDFWSRPADRERLKAGLVHAPRVSVVVIPETTHHVHLDRPERACPAPAYILSRASSPRRASTPFLRHIANWD